MIYHYYLLGAGHAAQSPRKKNKGIPVNRLSALLAVPQLVAIMISAPFFSDALADTAAIAETDAIMARDGGTVRLRDYAVLTAPPAAFDKATTVRLLATSDKATDEDYRTSMVFLDSFRRLPNEIRVRVGANPPHIPLILSARMPKSFFDATPKNQRVIAWVQIDQGDMDHFEVLSYTFNDKDSTVEIQLPPWAFTNKRPRSNREFEAVVILGTGASSSQPDERDRKIELLRKDLDQERARVKALTAELDALRPRSPGAAIPVTEIMALPKRYLDKEIVIEGEWTTGGYGFRLHDSVSTFTLRSRETGAFAYCYFQPDRLDPDSRRILMAKSLGQTVRVRGYLRDPSKHTPTYTPFSGSVNSFAAFEVTKVEY